jgi:hypothetical protein
MLFIESDKEEVLLWGISSYVNTIVSISIFYLIVNDVREINDFRILTLSIGGIVLFNFALLSISKIAPSLMGQLPGSWRVFSEAGRMRFMSTFVEYELYSDFLLIAVPLFIAMSFVSKRMIIKGVYLFLFSVALITFVYSVTRGPLFAMMASMTVVASLYAKNLNLRVIAYFMVFTLLILVLVFFTKLIEPSYYNLFRERIFATSFEGAIPETRMEVWSYAWNYILHEGNFFLGHGPAHIMFGFIEPSPHCLYLDILMRYGGINLVTSLFFFGAIFFRNRKAAAILKNNRDPLVTPFAFIEISFLAFLMDQIKIEYTRNAHYELFIWIYLGILVAVQNLIILRNPLKRKTS